MVTCMLVSGATVAQQQVAPKDVSGSAMILKPEDYVAPALESIRKSLASGKLPPEEFRLELVGEPIVRPDCSRLHPKGATTNRGFAPADTPDAFVLVNLYSGEVIQEQAMVVFTNNQPSATLSSREPSPFSIGAMDERELQQVAKELESFFAAAVDVSRGSERFVPYLRKDIRTLLKHPDRKFRLYMPPGAVDPSWREKLSANAVSRGVKASPLEGLEALMERLSDDELRRFVALTIDSAVQQAWLAIEGLPGGRGPVLPPVEALVSNPREYIRSLEDRVSQNRNLLKAAGVLTREHLRLTSSYMKRIIGQGFIVKEVSKPKACPCFLLLSAGEGFVFNRESLLDIMQKVPEEATLYLSSSGIRPRVPVLHFSWMGGDLRIVCVALP
jgi:hypothetical protein